MDFQEAVERVLAHIDPKRLVDLTASLVRINSVWDPEAGTSEREAAEFAAEWARDRGFEVERDQVAEGRPNVIVTHRAGPGRRKLMFEGHTDVVTPGDPAEWSHDPFGAQVEGRKMFGRGTNDTKGNLAAMLEAMAAIKASAVELAGTIVGGVLCDEEDRMLGVLDFIDRGRADDVTGAVICEPQDGMICTAQKGAIRARFRVTGRMSHGAMPLAGLNPAPAVARLIDGLADLQKQAAESHGRDEYLGWPSYTPTVIRAPIGGAPQLNVMPAKAEIWVDVRTIPTQDHGRIRDELRDLAESVQNGALSTYRDQDRRLGLNRDLSLTVDVDFLTDRPCTKTEPEDPLVAAADWAVRRATGREPVYGGVPGATDGTYLWAVKNIPIVTMGAGDREVPHQVDEWVDLDQLAETARTYALIALRYLWPDQTHAP